MVVKVEEGNLEGKELSARDERVTMEERRPCPKWREPFPIDQMLL